MHSFRLITILLLFIFTIEVNCQNKNKSKSTTSNNNLTTSAVSEAESNTGYYDIYNRNTAQWHRMNFHKHKKSDNSNDQSSSSTSSSSSSSSSSSKKTSSIKDHYNPNKLQYGQYYENLGIVSTPEECARECKEDEPPRVYYQEFIFEHYRSLGGACTLCDPKTNSSLYSDCQCIPADGIDVSGLLTINRMYPGPSIQVCLGDTVIIDVKNGAPGQELTIHWHGIFQENYQYYDGVPFVTQCPIPSSTTFRYHWKAKNGGTHWYHSHSGLQEIKACTGAIIIREPKKLDMNRKFYDTDSFDNLLFLGDWLHLVFDTKYPGISGGPLVNQLPDNVLLNGRGQWMNTTSGQYTNASLAVVNVKPGLRHRFRLINSVSLVCPVEFSIEGHNLTLIASDGESVKPRNVTTITSFAAERFDFILNAVERPGTYWIQLRLVGSCSSKQISQTALLHYLGSNIKTSEIIRPTFSNSLPTGILFNGFNQVCNGTNPNFVCTKNLESAEKPNPKILAERVDTQIVLPFRFYNYNTSLLYSDKYHTFITPGGGPTGVVPLISGISSRLPSSPFLSQARDIPVQELCNEKQKPKHCEGSPVCECTHFIKLKINSSVEIIMLDTAPNGLSHPFHLHGHAFNVMAQGLLSDVNITQENAHMALNLDRQKYAANINLPPAKDTLPTPSGGYTVVRFIANNPGYWIYHCHILPHLMSGMFVIFQVGEQKDVPPVPRGFPTCGNFLPPLNDGYVV